MPIFGALLNVQWRWNMTDETCGPRYYRSRHADVGWPIFRILTLEKYSTFDHLSSIFNTIYATNPIQVYIIRYRIKFCIEYNQLQTQHKSLSESGLQILRGLGEIQGISAETPYFLPMTYPKIDTIR